MPGVTLTKTVRQPDVACCLTGDMFKGIQWGNVINMKMMSRNISHPLCLAYPNICVGLLAGVKHTRIPKNFSPL